MPFFIDRKTELATLEREYQKNESSLVIVYGRRRVGKTALVTEFLRRHGNGFYYLATEETEAQNLRAFRNELTEFTGNALLASSNADWAQCFDEFIKHAPGEKKIIVMDEFQYIGRSNKAFPSIVQKIWDTKLKDANVMLILCGSLIVSMREQTLDYSSPLYGRRTAQIRLKQLPFACYADFFGGFTKEELIPFYAVTGGVPRYILNFRNETDIYEAIRHQILDPQSYLYEEPYFLLRNEVSEVGSYFSILHAIANQNHKLSEIAGFLGVKQTNLPKYLNTLIDLDILEREVPVTEQNPGKSKSGLYTIKDNYLAFWFRFVYPYRSYLEKGEYAYVLDRIRSGFIQNHASYVYEQVCREQMWALGAAGLWPEPFEKCGRYWGKETGKTDIVAYTPGGKHLILGECKYTRSPKGTETLRALQDKAASLMRLTGTTEPHFILFSTAGFTKELEDTVLRNPHLLLIDRL